MSNYPYGYPDQRLIVGNTDLTTEFQMVLIDGFELNPPEPKFYTIDIPGGNGVIDLTEALGGDVAFSNREQQFTFKLIYPAQFEMTKTKVSNFLHGKFFNYRLTWDPPYTYKGRFSVVSYSHIGLAAGKLGEIVIKVTADPYKYMDDRTYAINGVGGERCYFPSGRKPVRPVVQTTRVTRITWKGETFKVGAGTHRLNDVLFTEGINELYVNTYEIFDTKWQDISRGGSHQLTWDEASKYNWDELQRIKIDKTQPNTPSNEKPTDPVSGRADYYAKAYRWNEILEYTWDYLKTNGWTWDGLNSTPSLGDGKYDFSSTGMYITYEWGDL